MKALRNILFVVVVVLGFGVINASDLASVGTWDSSSYNLMDHPHTVALRIEVLDSETRLPIKGAQILLKGTYETEVQTSRHPDGEQRAQERECEIVAETSNDGIAVISFGWQKEYPWSKGIDEIEKVQDIEVSCRGYRFVQQGVPFQRYLDVGQNKDSVWQEPKIFEKFERAWAEECSRSDVRFFTLDLGRSFSDSGNKRSSHSEFFKRVYNKDFDNTYKAPRNWFSKDEYGPYFVYIIRIYMDPARRYEHSR